MEALNILSDIASLVSLILAIAAWRKASGIENKLRQGQVVRTGLVSHSPITQTMTGVNTGKENKDVGSADYDRHRQ